MYLVSGMVARTVAGPGVILSFIIAAVASIFSGEYTHALHICLSIQSGRRDTEITLSVITGRWL